MEEKQTFREIPLDQITPSPENPRKSFAGKGMDELVESIRSVGVLEPILVRPLDAAPAKKARGKKILTASTQAQAFEIVAGERRFRASCIIANGNGGLASHTIPAMVRPMTDDQAWDAMVIENLARQDLNELEEARGFQAYLDRKGPEALEDLAGRTGISPGYIRRRLRVLDLPGEILEAWDGDVLRFGHLEQLLRLPDQEAALDLFERFLGNSVSVKRLRSIIDDHAVPLKKAPFDLAQTGCSLCMFNSDTQKQLFDTESDKTLCLKPACYKEHLLAWLRENWKGYRKKMKLITQGPAIYDVLNWNDYSSFYGNMAIPDECLGCEKFVTLISVRGDIQHERACLGEESCFRALTSSTRKKVESARQRNHGPEFRERFFQEQIPLRIRDVDPDADKALHLALFALLKSNKAALIWYGESYSVGKVKHPGEPWAYLEINDKELFESITALSDRDARLRIRNVSTVVALQGDTMSAREHVASYLGVDVATEWRIHKEYLERKTKAEILDLGEELGILQEKQAQDFLFETLGKKRGRFDTCKKGELIRVFLDSGVDLAGRIPAEILEQTG
ncbi:MAG: ParB/RepB/Spo0J family partition protein [Desulfatibacillum sp.]|nr:ParB/RepB/Spo0J family partition protein [Desulfatibacillum sp.]